MSLQTIFKDSKGRWRHDVLWKIVPYTWRSDRKWPIRRPPTVVRRVRRTTSIDDDAERSLHRARESAGRLSWPARYGGAPLPSASEVDGETEWCDQTSTTSKLVEQLHSSLTGAAEEDVVEYRPVSRYRSPDDWGQVTSPVTEPIMNRPNGSQACSLPLQHSTLNYWFRM